MPADFATGRPEKRRLGACRLAGGPSGPRPGPEPSDGRPLPTPDRSLWQARLEAPLGGRPGAPGRPGGSRPTPCPRTASPAVPTSISASACARAPMGAGVCPERKEGLMSEQVLDAVLCGI